jgi:hypothetical protein
MHHLELLLYCRFCCILLAFFVLLYENMRKLTIFQCFKVKHIIQERLHVSDWFLSFKSVLHHFLKVTTNVYYLLLRCKRYLTNYIRGILEQISCNHEILYFAMLYGKQFNLTHKVNHLSFGVDYPGQINPLDNAEQIADKGTPYLFILFELELGVVRRLQQTLASF